MTTDLHKAEQKKKRDLIITSILVVIFFITFTQNVLFRNKKDAVVPASEPVGPSQSLSEQMVFVTNMRVYDNLRKERVLLWDREWGRDPFAQQATASAIVKAVNMTLKGVLWDEQNPKAIVNEKMLVIGDTIYGYTVENITPKSIILKTGEKTIELQVFRSAAGDLSGSN